ncbi:hypothetical protein, partial [Tenuifilum sp.]|uniref:hypothetical protein n=2 Tax=Tenuifilum sp. TaxID=2760880 RepID=UPI002BDAB0AD|nr:hypothetical protein [Tenuifilum sp.]HQE53922.1 hypothetical protein [Tenuifilum sp.]HQG73644.1 hypothetical protein [Tenuifilum sp.]HRS43696.1 hypothetical protein [Tenuifilum sp.]HRU86638.1 hypothetical protein [Tenuifilum sp.]
MKKILFLLLVVLMGVTYFNKVNAQSEEELVQICTMVAGDAEYLKDFRIKLDAGDPPPVQRFPILLKKDIKYRFTVCNSKDYEGKVILQLFDNNRQLATTYIVATGKDYPYIDWVCTKTGAYHLVYSFRDGKAG